jgi:hypothetical protein
MKAVVFPGERKVQFLDFPDPTPGPGEVVLEIKASGMCGSDLKFYRAVGGASSLGLGKVSGPVIAGHEPCGVVVAVGAGVAEKQARAKEFGADVLINPLKTQDVVSAIRDLTHGRGADASLDASSSPLETGTGRRSLQIVRCPDIGQRRHSPVLIWRLDLSSQRRSERTRQVEDVLGDVGKDQVGRDRCDLIQPRLAELALDIVFAGETEAAVELQAGIGRLP